MMAALATVADAYTTPRRFDIAVEQDPAAIPLSIAAFSVVAVSALLALLHVP